MIVKYPVSYLKWEICQQYFKKRYISSGFLCIDLMVKYHGIIFWQLDQNRLFLAFSISEAKNHHIEAFKIILLFIIVFSKDAEFSFELSQGHSCCQSLMCWTCGCQWQGSYCLSGSRTASPQELSSVSLSLAVCLLLSE